MRRRTIVVALGVVALTLAGAARVRPWPPWLSQKGLPQARADDVAEQVFNNACRTCHSVKEGDNRLGPNLFKIVGRRAGSLLNYNYSVAMKDAGFTWDGVNLARFISNPDEVVPGNTMKPYSGLRSADDAKKIVAFLRSVGSR
jgi:cytochrome c